MWNAYEARAMGSWVAIENMEKLQETDLSGAEVVILQVLPSQQPDACAALSERLVPGQTLLFSPGKLASQSLSTTFEASISLAETSAPLLPTKPRPIWLSSSDPLQTKPLLETLTPHFPNLLPADSVQEVAINDIGAVLYPASLLLNTARVDQMGPYRTAHCDVTPAVARCLQALDQERLQLARTFGWTAYSLPYLLGSGESDYYRALSKCREFSRHMAPDSVHHAHFLEEIPYTLAPLLKLASSAEFPVPHLQAIQTLAQAICERDLVARRAYVEKPPQPAPEPEGVPFDPGTLQETLVDSQPSSRVLALSVDHRSLSEPKSESTPTVQPDSDIARSFQKLREALEQGSPDQGLQS